MARSAHQTHSMPGRRLWPPVLRIGLSVCSNCDSRKYTYFMPTYLFIPPKPGSNLEQSLKSVNPPEQDISRTHPFWHAYVEQSPTSHEEDLPRKRTYRASTDEMRYFREVMDKYEGSHNFHNFTVGADYSDRSSRRFMKKIEVCYGISYLKACSW